MGFNRTDSFYRFFVINWPCLTRACKAFYRAGFFVTMPVLKKLTFSIVLWRDENDDLATCLLNTLLLGIVSGPALVVVVTEIFVFIDGE